MSGKGGDRRGAVVDVRGLVFTRFYEVVEKAITKIKDDGDIALAIELTARLATAKKFIPPIPL